MTKRTMRAIFQVIVIAVAAMLLVLPQLFRHGIILGSDISFHYLRFYDTYMQMKTGHFNFIQSLFGFSQSGRIVNALYGAGFAYFAGLILLLVQNWFRFQVLMGFLCEFFAGMSMLFLMHQLMVRNWIRTIMALLYMSSFVVDTWVLNQSFTGWGAVFLPLALASGVRALRDKQAHFNPLILGLSISLLFMTHLVSTMLAVVALFLLFGVALFVTNDKLALLKNLGVAVAAFALLSSFNLFTFLSVETGNTLFTPWKNLAMLDATSYLSLGDNGMSAIGLIYSGLFLLQISVVFTSWRKRTVQERTLTSVGLLFLVLSSRLVPWDDLAMHFSGIAAFQFPLRLVVVAYVLLLAGFGLTLEGYLNTQRPDEETIRALVWTVSLLAVFSAMNQVDASARYWRTSTPAAAGDNGSILKTKDPAALRAAFSSPDLVDGLNLVMKAAPDYLPVSNHQAPDSVLGYQLYAAQVLNNRLPLSKKVTGDSELALSWKTSSTKEAQLPVIVYRHSTVMLNGQAIAVSDIRTSDIGALKVKPRKGQNRVVVGYDLSGLGKGLIWVQGISWIMLILGMFIAMVRRMKTRRADSELADE